MGILNHQTSTLEKNNHHALGECKAHFPVRHQKLKRALLLVAGPMIIITSLIFSLFFFLELQASIEIHGRAILLSQTPFLFAQICFGLPLGILILTMAKIHWWNGVTIYERGLVCKIGSREVIWAWQEISRLDSQITEIKFSGDIIGTRIRLLLGNLNQKTLTIQNRYEHMPVLIAQVRSNVLPNLYKKACQYMLRGESITFNQDLIANQTGMTIQDDFTPWSELNPPVIKNGSVELFKKTNHKKRYQSKINQIKNLDLLIHLIKYPPTRRIQSSPR